MGEPGWRVRAENNEEQVEARHALRQKQPLRHALRQTHATQTQRQGHVRDQRKKARKRHHATRHAKMRQWRTRQGKRKRGRDRGSLRPYLPLFQGALWSVPAKPWGASWPRKARVQRSLVSLSVCLSAIRLTAGLTQAGSSGCRY